MSILVILSSLVNLNRIMSDWSSLFFRTDLIKEKNAKSLITGNKY